MKGHQEKHSFEISKEAILGSLLILLFSNCQSKRGPEIYRLIDHLDKRNIISTPLAGLDRYFPLKSYRVPAKDLKRIELDGQSYWAVATLGPVACPADYDIPPDLAVSQDGKKLATSMVPLDDSLSWRWFSGDRDIDFTTPEQPSDRFLHLQREQIWESSLVLPGGQAVIEIFARSGNPDSYRACLEVEVNDSKTELCIGHYRAYKFVENLHLGLNQLKITLKKSVPHISKTRRATNEAVHLETMKITALRDLILISPPANENSLEGDFGLSYPAEPVDQLIPIKKRLVPLDGLEQTFNLENPAANNFEIVYQAGTRSGLLSLWHQDKQISSAKITGRKYFSHSFQAEQNSPATLELRFQPDETIPDGDKMPPGPFLDSLIITNPLKAICLPLYQLKDFRIYDLGIGENPYLIKKNLKVQGESFNSFFAAPPTRLKFRLRIPDDGMLSFGYGLLSNSWNKEGDGVLFEILAETSASKETLFSARVHPSHKPKDKTIFTKNINLSRFRGKTITLWFQTYGGLEEGVEEESDHRDDLGLWANPFVYQNKPEGLPTEDPANIILISLDTMGASHLGCYGYAPATSPHLDELARESALFLQAFSAAPYTLPSHMSIFTGLAPPKHQVFFLDQSLDPDIHSLTELLRSRGYLTAAFTDDGQVSSGFGFSRGFDYYEERRGGERVIRSAELLHKRAASWINDHRGLKNFLFLHTYQTHNPYKSPAPYGQVFLKENHPWKGISLEEIFGPGFAKFFKNISEQERENMVALYDGEIRYTDEFLIKPLLDELRKLNLYDRTMLIVTADHGEAFGEHGHWMHSWNIYNEVARVPLIIKFPRSRHGGRIIHDFVGTIDIMPTILEEANISRSGISVDGESLLNILNQQKTEPKSFLIYQPAYMTAAPTPRKIGLFLDPFKLVINEDYPPQAYKWFSPSPPRQEDLELYDLRKDPGERKNLAGLEKNIVQELISRVQVLLKDLERERSVRKLPLDRDLLERLRALGYIE